NSKPGTLPSWQLGTRNPKPGTVPLPRVPPFHGQDLLDDFVHAQVAFKAIETACTKLAAIGAADLGGDTERMPVAGLAIQGRVGRDEHAFDQRAIGEFPEELL